MFAGCSEISTSVLDKHGQNVEIIRDFCLPWGIL